MEDNRKKNNDECIKMSQWDADEHGEAFDVVFGRRERQTETPGPLLCYQSVTYGQGQIPNLEESLQLLYAYRAVPIGKARFLIL